MSIYAGTAIAVTCTFTDVNGNATDPTTVTLKYSLAGQPTTTVSQSSLTHVSTGVWSYTISTAGMAGSLTIEWIGTGSLAAVGVLGLSIVADPL